MENAKLELVLKTIEDTVPDCRVERTPSGITIHIGEEGARMLESIDSLDISWLKEVVANIKIVRARVPPRKE